MICPGLGFYQVCIWNRRQVSHSHSHSPTFYSLSVHQTGVWNMFSSLRSITWHTCEAFRNARTTLLLLLLHDEEMSLVSCLMVLIMMSTLMLYNCFSLSCQPATRDNNAHLEHICVYTCLCVCVCVLLYLWVYGPLCCCWLRVTSPQ